MSPPVSNSAVVVRLIDPNQGRPLQEWRFDAASEISIGRADDRDIVIPDPQVSRLHVTLKLRDEKWWLISQGQNGVLVDGLMVEEVPAGGDMTFRLGANGPLLSFHDSTMAKQSSSATVQSLDLDELANLKLDELKLEADVREIADGEFFQKLLTESNQLRQRKPTDDSTPAGEG